MFSLTLRKLLILYAFIYLCILVVLAIIFSRDLQMLDKEFEHLSCTSHVNTVIMMIRQTETDYILGSREQDFQQNRKLLEDLGDTLESMVGNFSDTKFPLDLKGLSGLPGEYRAAMGELRRQMTNDMAADHEINNVEALGLKLLEYSGRLISNEQERLGGLVSSFKRKLVIFVPVFLLVFILISFFQLRGVLSFLKKLEDAAMAIARGNFSYLKPDQARSYVHGVYVFRAFNKMLEELKVNQEKLLESHKLSSLGTLASGIAHQLNNPLNNIATSSQIGLTELEEGDPGQTARMLKTINEEALRAGDIVHGLLEYSRQETLTVKPAFLAQVVNKAVRLMGDSVPADIEIKNLVPDDLSFPMDAQKMTEVFLNLLTNAVHA
ncbi:MAG: HAMP domain-containing histidine kinase, partial [Desulfobulbaceae bacterium]|nr:HAMP domain-containing histidine kinase [Desulfobulbaceae bacterium]